MVSKFVWLPCLICKMPFEFSSLKRRPVAENSDPCLAPSTNPRARVSGRQSSPVHATHRASISFATIDYARYTCHTKSPGEARTAPVTWVTKNKSGSGKSPSYGNQSRGILKQGSRCNGSGSRQTPGFRLPANEASPHVSLGIMPSFAVDGIRQSLPKPNTQQSRLVSSLAPSATPSPKVTRDGG